MQSNPAELTEALNDLEQKKFEVDDNNDVRIRTTSTGTYTPTGLKTGLKITTMEITDVATPIPLAAFNQRNSISIYNKDSVNTVYVGPSNVTADTVIGTTSGWEMDAGSYLNFDITDSIIIYAICESGKTAIIKVLEIA
jgi:hypothetical protein